MKVLGKRVLIAKPEKVQSPVVLSPEAEAEMERELMLKWNALEVVSIGDEVTKMQEGDKVYVGTSIQHAEIVVINEKHYFLVNEAAVLIVW